MGYVKGMTGNPDGRPKGTPNKINQQLRETIGDFLLNNFSKVIEDFEALQPKDRAKLYCDLLQYGLPRLQAVQMEGDFEKLTDGELDHIIKELKANIL
jgi:hypothetical protein